MFTGAGADLDHRCGECSPTSPLALDLEVVRIEVCELGEEVLRAGI